jgi:hypothetical protein
MCYPIKCSKCHKIAWNGCGLHIESIKQKVPLDKRCTCINWE